MTSQFSSSRWKKQNHRRWRGHDPITLDPYPSRHERGRWRPIWSHPKTHCPKRPPIKPILKQPPNQHPKPPKHPATTGEQSPPPTTHGPQPMASKAHHPQPRGKWNRNPELKNLQATTAITVFLPLLPPSLASAVSAALKLLNWERQSRDVRERKVESCALRERKIR